jgi:hypothetical protein
MDKKLESITTKASELSEIVQLEEEILKKLIQSTAKHLSGCWVHSRNRTAMYDLKIKVNGYHLLASVGSKSVSVELIKSVPETRRGKIIEFKNTQLAYNWQSARQYISLTDVVNECCNQINKKIADAKKTNLDEIDKKITEIREVI